MATGFVRESLHFRRPVTPLFSTVVLPAIERGHRRAAAPVGAGTLELRVFHGHVYGMWSPPTAPPPPRPDDAPDLGQMAERWAREDVPRARALLDELRALAGPTAGARRVAAEAARVEARLEDLYAIHYEAALATQAGWGMLEDALARAGDARAALTVATLVAPAPSLLRDAERWLAERAGWSADALAASPGWDEVADRPAWPDLGAPTWREDPALAARASAAASLRAFEEGTARALARREEAERATLARFPPAMEDTLRLVLDMVRRARGVQQTLNFLVGELALGAARGAWLRAGARLVDAGVLARAEDVVLLDRDEALAALRGEPLPPGLVEARREALSRAAAATPPEVVGEVDEALLRDPRVASLLGHRPGGGDLSGLGASPGVVAGPARVARSPEDLDALREGEVLVVEALDPAWTAAAQRAAALVSELGGMLSHAAVVARELGRPAVVGVSGATRRLRSGERIVVDGDRGTVAVEEVDLT